MKIKMNLLSPVFIAKQFPFGAFFLVFILTTPSPAAVSSLSARDIMLRNEQARKFQDIQSSAVLETGGKDKTTKVKRFTWWKKLSDDQVHFNTLTRFEFPPEVKGEGILFLERTEGQNEVLMYLPTYKKVRRVESQAQSGSFMGSEFSYSDITSPHVDDFEHKLVGEEVCEEKGAKEKKEESLRCYVIESTPKKESLKERTGSSLSKVWVRNDNFMVERAEYLDLQGKLWKKMTASAITQVDPERKTWMAHRVEMRNLKRNRFTVLQFKQVKVNRGIPDSLFTQANLAQGR